MPLQCWILLSVGFGILMIIFWLRRHASENLKWLTKESIVDSAKEGFLVVDAEYHVLYANHVIREKYPTIMSLKSEKEKAELVKIFQQPEMLFERDDFCSEIRVSPIYDGNVLRGYMAWTFDRSLMNQYAAKISQLKDEVEKANQAKEALLVNISHEIHTPMNAILGFAELILQQKDNSALTQEYAFDIRRSAKNLLHTMNELLDVSKVEAGKMEMVIEVYHTQSLLEDVSRVIGSQIKEKGLQYEAIFDTTLPYRMKGAATSLREILINVLNNAMKYTEKGTISLDVHSKWKTEKQIQLEMVVTDTGIGMRSKDVETIFDKFSQSDMKDECDVEGIGLGMAIAKGLVEQLDGEIKVESEYGEGTKITICLLQEIVDERPMGDIKLSLLELDEKEFCQAFITTAKVLIVDDNELNLKMTSALLQRYDIEADIADSGYTAIDAIRNKEYDVVFMDHMMPGMDGVETMLRIREMDKGKHGRLPIIALTANAIAGVKEDMLMIGFDGYISKPIDVRELEHTLLNFVPKNKISYVDASVVDHMSLELIAQQSAQEILEESDVLKHMDIQVGIQNCGGTLSDYYQVLDVVLKYGERRIQKLKQLIEDKDYKGYALDVRALKSTAENIGAMRLSEMALDQENAGKMGDYEFIEEHYEELLDLYQEILKEIADVRLEEDAVSVKDTRLPEIGGQDSGSLDKTPKDIHNGMNTATKNGQGVVTMTEQTVPVKQSSLSDAELRSLLGNVIQMLDDFEMDKAKEILNEMVEIANQ